MKIIRITALFLSVLVAFSVLTVVTDSRAYAFDKSKIEAAEKAAGDVSRHIGSTKQGYYGYALKCIQTDILAKKGEMADPGIQKTAGVCISYYRTGFGNLKAKYDAWEAKSRELRDALQAEK